MDIAYSDNFMVCILVLNAVILMYSSVVSYKSLPNVFYTRVYKEGLSYPIPIALVMKDPPESYRGSIV